MKNKLVAVVILLLIAATGFAQKADDLIGKYRLPNKLDVEIYKTGDKYSGKIIALNNFEEGQTKDIKNPDKSKRNEHLLGMVIIKNLEYDSDEKKWLNGEMYGPEKGMFFHLKVNKVGNEKIEVVGSKYFFRRTLEWKKLLL